MKLSLNQAAKEAGKAKSTLLLSIRNGDLTAPKNAKGRYEIDPAELFRVFPKPEEVRTSDPRPTPEEYRIENKYLLRDVDALNEQIEDLKKQRDKWQGEASAITRLLENHTRPKGLMERIFGSKKQAS